MARGPKRRPRSPNTITPWPPLPPAGSNSKCDVPAPRQTGGACAATRCRSRHTDLSCRRRQGRADVLRTATVRTCRHPSDSGRSRRAISSATTSCGAACSGAAPCCRRCAARASSCTTGRTLAVVGESGCGKSTLARLVTLIEPPSAGRLEIDGIDVGARHARASAGTCARPCRSCSRTPTARSTRARRSARSWRSRSRSTPAWARPSGSAAARDMLAEVGLRPEHYGRYPHMFSGGQRQRIAVARALMLRPKIVVLDEPVSALDVSVQAQVLNLLLELQSQFRLAYLFISHDLSVVRHVADEVIVMYLGRPIEQGPRDDVFERPLHPYTRALQASSPIDRSTAARQRLDDQGRAALAARPAARLRLPSALPVRQRALPDRGAEAPAVRGHRPTSTPATRSRSAACRTFRPRRTPPRADQSSSSKVWPTRSWPKLWWGSSARPGQSPPVRRAGSPARRLLLVQSVIFA